MHFKIWPGVPKSQLWPFSYCHPILGSSSVNALSTVGRGVSFRQTGFIIIPLCLLNVNLLHGLFLFFTAEIALSG